MGQRVAWLSNDEGFMSFSFLEKKSKPGPVSIHNQNKSLDPLCTSKHTDPAFGSDGCCVDWK